MEVQRDKRVTATGIILNLSEAVFSEFDNHIPKVREFIGDPDHDFNHLYVNEDRKMKNNVFFIMSGLSPINDRIAKTSDRIEEIDEKQQIREEETNLNSEAINNLSKKISSKDKVKPTGGASSVDLTNIFSKFGI